MKTSLLTKLGVIVKKITGIKDISQFRKNIHKKLGKLLYHKKYTADDLVGLMKQMGMKQGSLVCIHCAMKEFYNYEGSATELIDKILDFIGPDGTLVMPAFPKIELSSQPNYVFNPHEDSTGAGYLAETFRKYPGVTRSINVRHSVCAIGRLAEYLLKDHSKSQNCWDEKSPWYRLCEQDALIFNIGMPHYFIGTIEHCVESLLRNEYTYFAQFFNQPTINRYYDETGSICQYTSIESNIEKRQREHRVTKYFTSKEWRINKISNLEVKVLYSKAALSKMIELARKGIVIYYVPNPRKLKNEH